MPHQSNKPTMASNTSNIDNLNLRKIYLVVVGNWYFHLFALVFAVVCAYLYLNYTIPSYRVTSTVLIHDEGAANFPDIESNLLQGFTAGPGAENLDNQMLILTSWSMMKEALEGISLDTECYKKGLLRDVSYYPLNPIRFEANSEGSIPENVEFVFSKYNGREFHISANDPNYQLDTTIFFAQDIIVDNDTFKIYPNPEVSDFVNTSKKIFFRFNSIESLLADFQKRLIVETASREGTILKLSLEGTNKAQDIMFLNNLIKVFMIDNLEKKNHEAKRIIAFIDEQLLDVSDSLNITENELQEFRSKNRIMDVSAQAQQIIDQAVVLENEKARLSLERNYFIYLDQYLAEANTQEIPIAPASMGIEDPLLTSLMQDLAGLQAEFFSSQARERNALQGQLEVRIRNTKQSIRETLQGILLANQMAIDENKSQIDNLNNVAAGLPAQERQLLGIERQFNLNSVLYTFLLQKRAEAQLQKASNKPDNVLIDPAIADPKQVAPNVILVYGSSILLGLGLPFLIIGLFRILRNRITSEEELTMMSSLPISGHIPHSRLSYNTVVLTESQSKISEAFRRLRTRMDFFTREIPNPVILVSSAIPKEGKTFVSINLASAYSLAGKKTLLVGFDLRKPSMSKSFNVETKNIGLSTYLIGQSKLEDIIMETGFENLDIIASGPIPPNPSELTATPKTGELFEALRKKYDFIIVDTAPIGVVTDGYSIASHADALIIVVRHGYSNKSILGATLKECDFYDMKNISLLINDIKASQGSYSYSYNYKYGYSAK